jgi:rhodanese-related sulfurtransferase
MKRGLTILSVAALAAFMLAVPVEANCGTCGTHPPAVKKACPANCSKPCCAAKVTKKGCGANCSKPCCAAKVAKKGCGAKCPTSACGTSKCPKTACGPDCKKPCGAAKGQVAEINTSGLKALMDAKAKLTILDARSGKYDDGRRIPGAKSLAPNASAEEAKTAIRSQKALVVTYCSNLKCPASARLAANLRKLGYTNVIEYRHGIQGWAAAGHPIDKAKQ